MSGGFLFQAFVFLSAAVITVPIAKRLGLGSVLGYLIAGIVIGPFVLGFVGQEAEDIMHAAEFGVVIMLFIVGLELEPTLLWRMRTSILGLGGLQVLLSTILFTAIGVVAGLVWQMALAVGMSLSLSSTAIVLSTMNEKGLMKTAGGQGAFSILLFQDIAVIPMLAIFPLLATLSVVGTNDHGSGNPIHNWMLTQPGWIQTLLVVAAVAVIVVGGHVLFRPIFRVIARTRLREIFTAAGLGLVIGIALLMETVGLSPALGTFLAGVVLANSEYRHELESDIDPFKGLLLGLFFITVGATIDFSLIAADPGLIGLLVVGLLLVKFLVIFGLTRLFGFSKDQGLFIAFGLPQAGEFAFVLFSFANQEGVLDSSLTAPLIAVVALTMAATPLILLVFERIVQPKVTVPGEGEREADEIEDQHPVLIAGFGGFGSTVGRFLRANGIESTVLDHDSDRVEILRKLGFKVYYGDACRRDLLHAAGAEKARLLVIAINKPEKTLELVDIARKHFPQMLIFARAFDWDDGHELVDAGVDHVYIEGLDASLRMGEDLMHNLGFRAHQMHRTAQRFRKHDEETLMKLTETYASDAGSTDYLSAVRHRIEELELLLRTDIDDASSDTDTGWDAESLREDARSWRDDEEN